MNTPNTTAPSRRRPYMPEVMRKLWSDKPYRLELMKRLIQNCALRPSGCIEWTMMLTDKGYGGTSVYGRQMRVHRLSWMFANGREVPEGLGILHRCDNPACMNPEHLFAGTHLENMEDMVAKGRVNIAAIMHMAATAPNQRKLTPEQVIRVRERLVAGEYASAIGRDLGVSEGCITNIKYNRNWKTV